MNRQTRHLDPQEHQETGELVKSAFSLARSVGIKTLVVQADEISDRRLVEPCVTTSALSGSLATGNRFPSLIRPRMW